MNSAPDQPTLVPRTAMLGSRRERYALDSRLGAGGMAEVFRGRALGAEGFARGVAIKRILTEYSASEQFAAMFIEEARLCARLSHANLVGVFDFDRDDEGRLFLVMELIEGVDLDRLLSSGMHSIPVVLYVITEMLRGLGYVHELPAAHDGVRGLVHRDVSPQNVLISWSGDVKVSDFGIAKARTATVARTTTIKGKPAYMSPEQITGRPLDARSDLFAVGVMLWQMLCGRQLFAGGLPEEAIAQILFQPIPAPSTLCPGIPPELERITLRLLAREVEDRYASAEAVIADVVALDAYPRDGRVLLVECLASSFPDRMPQPIRDARGIRPPGAVTSDERRALVLPPRARTTQGRSWSRARVLTVCGVLGVLLAGAVALGRAMNAPTDASSSLRVPLPHAADPPPRRTVVPNASMPLPRTRADSSNSPATTTEYTLSPVMPTASSARPHASPKIPTKAASRNADRMLKLTLPLHNESPVRQVPTPLQNTDRIEVRSLE